MNNVILIGRITKALALCKTQSGKSWVKFTLAVDRQGEGADFIGCTAWGKTAENMANYLSKGAKIAAAGRIQTDSYEKDGRKIYTTTVVCNNVQFLDGKKVQQADSEEYSVPEEIDDESLPWE